MYVAKITEYLKTNRKGEISTMPSNAYAMAFIDSSDIPDEDVHKFLKTIYQEIFKIYFGHRYVLKKPTGTIHPKMPCTCGSDKLYKKCCAKKSLFPDICDIMTV